MDLNCGDEQDAAKNYLKKKKIIIFYLSVSVLSCVTIGSLLGMPRSDTQEQHRSDIGQYLRI